MPAVQGIQEQCRFIWREKERLMMESVKAISRILQGETQKNKKMLDKKERDVNIGLYHIVV
jgi:hypothetical protein